MRRNKEAGFTRVDTLVTIIVITMIVTTSLAAIVPAMNKAREAAMRAQCANHMRQIGAAIAMYADSHNGWLPFYGGYDPNYDETFNSKFHRSPARDESHPFAAFRLNQQWMVDGKPVPMKLGCLYAAGIVTDARIFYCPANITKTVEMQAYQYESYVNPAFPNTSYEWGTLPQKFNADNGMNQWVRIGYTYFPVDSTAPTETNGDLWAPQYTARRFDKLDPNIPYLADFLWYRRSISHKTENGYSVNALFKDGHIVYCKDRRFFSDNPDDDPMRLWTQYEVRAIGFNYFYYNFLRKIGP